MSLTDQGDMQLSEIGNTKRRLFRLWFVRCSISSPNQDYCYSLNEVDIDQVVHLLYPIGE